MSTLHLADLFVCIVYVTTSYATIQIEYCSSNSNDLCDKYKIGGNEPHSDLIPIHPLAKSFKVHCSASYPIMLVVNIQTFFLQSQPGYPADVPEKMAPTDRKNPPLIVSKTGKIQQINTPDGQKVMEYHQSLELEPTKGMDGVIKCQSYSNSTANVQLNIYVERNFHTFWDVTSKLHFLFLGSRNESILPCLFYGISDDDIKQLAVYKIKSNFMLTDGHTSNDCINASSSAFLSLPENFKPTGAEPTIDPSRWAGQDCDEDGFSSCSDAFNYALIPDDCSRASLSWKAYRLGKLQFYHFILLTSLKNISVPVEIAHYDRIRGAVLNEMIDPNAEYVCVKETSSDVPNTHAVSYVPLAENAKVRAEITMSESNRTGWYLTCAVNDFSVNDRSKLKVVRVPCDSLIACDAIFRPELGLGRFTDEEKFVVHHTPLKAPFFIKVEAPILTETERMVACTGIIFKNTDNSRHYVQEIFHVFKGFDERLHVASSNYSSEVVMSAKLSGQLQEDEAIRVICQIKTFTLFQTIRFVLRYETDGQNAVVFETIPLDLEVGSVTATDGRWRVTSVKAKGAKEAERELTVLASPQLKEIKCEAPEIHRPNWVHVTINTEIAPKSRLSAAATVGITLGAVGVIVIFFAVIYLLLQYPFIFMRDANLQEAIRQLTLEEEYEFCNGNKNSGATAEDGGVNIKHIAFPPDFRLSLENLKIDRNRKLGEGEYGVCFQGELENRGSVAVKSVKPNADVNIFKDFLREVKIMAYVGQHANIIQMFGAVVEDIRKGVCYAVVELSPFGDLLNILRKSALSHASPMNMSYVNVTAKDGQFCGVPQLRTCHLVTLALHIARGMEYLSSKRLIHGDLAARNVLVFPNLVAKISDFGMSRRLYGSSEYMKKSKQAVPWRWMALESLQFLQFSQKSDVWAYGITLWEVFTFGDVPFPGRIWNEKFMQDLEHGVRPIQPRHASDEIFHFMSECWATCPQNRPSFSDAVVFFESQSEHSYANFQEDVVV